jgi:hypothetical protein
MPVVVSRERSVVIVSPDRRACRIMWLAGIVSRIEPVACRISGECVECGIERDDEIGGTGIAGKYRLG